jgi:hypothetical protein
MTPKNKMKMLVGTYADSYARVDALLRVCREWPSRIMTARQSGFLLALS